MEIALRRTYDAAPEPRIVVAVGACGCSGGIFGEATYAAVGGVGFDRTAKPLLVPLMIKVTAAASTIVAPNTSARRAQYVCAVSWPTGCSRPLMQRA